MATQTQQTNYSNNFDLGFFFDMIRNIPAGLCWYLAEKLLESAAQKCGRNKRDMRDRTEDIIDMVVEVRELNKKFNEQSERSPNVKG